LGTGSGLLKMVGFPVAAAATDGHETYASIGYVSGWNPSAPGSWSLGKEATGTEANVYVYDTASEDHVQVDDDDKVDASALHMRGSIIYEV